MKFLIYIEGILAIKIVPIFSEYNPVFDMCMLIDLPQFFNLSNHLSNHYFETFSGSEEVWLKFKWFTQFYESASLLTKANHC